MKKTREVAGVARRGLPLVLFAALAALPVWSSAWDETSDAPASSEGDIIFHADVVTFYDSDTTNLEEIYCAVSNDQIEFVEEGDLYVGTLRYTVEISTQGGDLAGRSDTTVSVAAGTADDAGARSVIQILQTGIRVRPGRYSVKVRVEDLNARKRELVSYIFGKYKSGEVLVDIVSGEFPDGQISLSDIELARSLRRTSEGGFQKHGFEVIPNPQRRYGLLLQELPFYFEILDLTGSSGGKQFVLSYAIINREGSEIFREDRPLSLEGQRTGASAVLDITSLPAGSYRLRVSILGPEGETVAESSRRLDVVWLPLSWGRYGVETVGDLLHILTEDEMETFKGYSAAGQEEYLKEFWRGLDPTPGTPYNEALIEHYRRVEFADKQFGTAQTRGALSDRGRLYIKYGPAADVKSYYSDYELVKGTRDFEGGADPIPTDPFSRVGLKVGTSQSGTWAGSSEEAEAYTDQRGGSTVHGKAYEVWTYDGTGNPLRDFGRRSPTAGGMRFIFVDERGIGEYQLVYSTEKQEY
jgi:GWxTD domain-containing protein